MPQRLFGPHTFLVPALLLWGCDRNDENKKDDHDGASDDPSQVGSEDREPQYLPEDLFTAAWTPNHVRRITPRAENTAPVIDQPDESTIEGFHVWDSWPVRNRDGTLARIDGYRILISLAVSDDILPGQRHDIARHRYLYSRDGQDWQDGGLVFPEGTAFGSRQWAGSAMYDEGEFYMFYTAAGERDAAELDYNQRMAVATGASVETGDDELRFVGEWEHDIIAEPDGIIYQNEEQSEGLLYAFRDPWYFRNPGDDMDYILFTANNAGIDAERPRGVLCDVAGEPVGPGDYSYGRNVEGRDLQYNYNGVVGIARAVEGDLTQWELLAPLLHADCTNQELERPHIVIRDDLFYLFFSTHQFTFAPNLEGPEALVGFVGESLRSNYRPLNNDAIVVANPEEAPYQAYSWDVLANGIVTSFVNYTDVPEGMTLDDLGAESEELQFRTFGGMLAPSLQLEFDGDRVTIVEELGFGQIE
jgi:levansucrase